MALSPLLLVASVVWATLACLQSSSGGLGLDQFVYLSYSGLFLAGASLLLLVARRIRRRQASGPHLGLPVAAICVGAFLARSPAPMFLRFLSSRGSLEAEAHALLKDPALASSFPHRVGLFRVSEVSVHESQVGFVTAPCGLDDCGFVFTPLPRPRRYTEDRFVHLAGPWWRWRRSW
jgi:hypothetical protein